ncbi:hypothetical protein [Streptomyces sp. NBC_00091]|uniref:hypothetical protein n=1 Tax=Streptomyces sp. NBC_00091 TaxID=2975648 RepID=UPI00225B4005|nr:hypothetical protein [Streptomyces sp. NBC_00091]MCX5380587.1 hypothetical protein [Streptomyces sp. NBC_00091]
MYAKIARIAPLALVTAGLIMAGPAALAAPQHDITAVSVQEHRAKGKKGPYPSKSSCEAAGKKGHYKSYVCKQEAPHEWWLHYTTK